MTIFPALGRRSASLWAGSGKAGPFLLALTIGGVLAVISWQAGILDDSTNVFGGIAGNATSASNPGIFVAIGAALIIGATMIVLPCGMPAVFVMPTILGSRQGLVPRSGLSAVFLTASVVPLAALGLGLGFAGNAVLAALDSTSAKMGFAVILYSSIGLIAIAYALSELGLFHIGNPAGMIRGPGMPGTDQPYRRAAVLGSTMGAGMGIGCPMPTYYILLGWVAAAANPLYGAIVMGAYGLGRVLPAIPIGALIVAGTEGRAISRGMISFREKTNGVSNGLVTATGAYLIVLFGGVLLYRWITL